MRGRMSGFLCGLDDWLLREDPDVCAGGAEELKRDGDNNDTDDDDQQDAAWDAARSNDSDSGVSTH